MVNIGLTYLSKTSGIGGSIKERAEDFVVEEVTEEGDILEINKKITKDGVGDFTYFVLKKKNWNTLQALKEIGKQLHISLKRFGYAGIKDRKGITTQLISVFKADIGNINIKDIEINGVWKEKKKLEIGDLIGNRFTIKVRGVSENSSEIVEKIFNEISGMVPNYFGEQRFGSIRKNTSEIGKHIIKGEFKHAVLNYLTYINENEREDAKAARKELSETMDYKKALVNFPFYLKYERILLAHLSKYPNDYVNALRKLPRGLSLLFVHAYQSFLFNELLSARIKDGLKMEEGDIMCGKNFYGFPDLNKTNEHGFLVGRTIGYETAPNEREKELLEKEGVSVKDFKIRSFPELSSKGTLRPLLIPLKDFSFMQEDENGIFMFSIPAGAYATVVLREFLDKKCVLSRINFLSVNLKKNINGLRSMLKGCFPIHKTQ